MNDEEIKCEKSYGIPIYDGLATVTIVKPTWKDNVKYRFRMAKYYMKRKR